MFTTNRLELSDSATVPATTRQPDGALVARCPFCGWISSAEPGSTDGSGCEHFLEARPSAGEPDFVFVR